VGPRAQRSAGPLRLRTATSTRCTAVREVLGLIEELDAVRASTGTRDSCGRAPNSKVVVALQRPCGVWLSGRPARTITRLTHSSSALQHHRDITLVGGLALSLHDHGRIHTTNNKDK
jgi:hypothetical protein